MIIINFLDSLGEGDASNATIKNYKSDLGHFGSWITNRLKKRGVLMNSLSESVPYLRIKLVREYVAFLMKTGVARSTINRRLSAMRKFSLYLMDKSLLSADFMKGVGNIPSEQKGIAGKQDVVEMFRKHLSSQKVKSSTAKNYLSDVRHFLGWLEEYYE